jgi:tetratricopeptide (TPR) repeat protein
MINRSINIFIGLSSMILCASGILVNGNTVDSQTAKSILLARDDMDIIKLERLAQHVSQKTELNKDRQFYYLAFLHLNIAIYYFKSQPHRSLVHLNDALVHISKSLEYKKTAEALILKAHLADFQLLFDASRTEELLQIFQQSLNEAHKIDPDNPRFYLVQGLHLYFAPSFAGGDIPLAKQNLLKAVRLFANRNATRETFLQWGYEDALAWLGQIAVQQDSLELAIRYYDQALSVNENFNWIKYGLMPKVQSAREVKNSLFKIVIRFIGIVSSVLIFLFFGLWLVKIKIIKI